MELKNLIESVKKLKESSTKRNFKQRIDLVITLKNLDLKKPEEHVDLFVTLHHSAGKKKKVCGLVGAELVKQSKEVFDHTINADEFDSASRNKKELKKLAREYDYFVAQATVMPKVAQAFGKVLGPRGKMPNPKAGCVVPPNANLKPLYERLQNTVAIRAKTQLMVQATVGGEESKEEEVADNIQTIYSQLVLHLPAEKLNIKAAYIKLTMGKPLRLDEKGKAVERLEEQKEETADEAKAAKKERRRKGREEAKKKAEKKAE